VRLRKLPERAEVAASVRLDFRTADGSGKPASRQIDVSSSDSQLDPTNRRTQTGLSDLIRTTPTWFVLNVGYFSSSH
jgi:hypothetical protein